MYREEASSIPSAAPADTPVETKAEAIPAPPLPAPTKPALPAAAAPDSNQKPARASRRKAVFGMIATVAAIGAGWFGYNWWTVGRFTVTTDDAYIQAYNTTLAAKVSGYLAGVPVTDNTPVRAGDVIATIDDGDYKLAVDSARGKVATQQATIARIGHQITAQEAAVEQAKTQLLSAQAAATRTELELDRQNLLVARDASSRQLLEQAQANRDQAIAAVQGARAAIEFGRRHGRGAQRPAAGSGQHAR